MTETTGTGHSDGHNHWIPLTRGYRAKVSGEDYKRVAAIKWRVKTKDGLCYAVAHVPGSGKRGKSMSMHRFILGAKPGEIVDHRDGDGLNNTRKNLRSCSTAQNIRNSKPYRGRRAKGVTKNGEGYRAQIMFNRKKFNLGKFLSLDAAQRAYDAAARLYFGEFARTNFPPDVVQQPASAGAEAR